MSDVPGIAGAATPDPTGRHERLRQAARDLEGVFVSQLFQAMRATVPRGEGLFEANPIEETYTSMLDEMLGQLAAERMQGGLGEALYRQLSRRLAEHRGSETP